MFSWNLLLLVYRNPSLKIVSILVFVELALDGSGPFKDSVSILVFVELALLDVLPSGCLVSILVFVELALDVWAYPKIPKADFSFQSLFSWNLLLMDGLRNQAASANIGFNPCFRGTCS